MFWHIPISRVDPTGGLVFVVDKVGFAIVVHANVPSFRQRTILEVWQIRWHKGGAGPRGRRSRRQRRRRLMIWQVGGQHTMRRGWWPPFGHLGHVPWHFCKAHYGLFSFFSMWLVFDFSMTDRHCYTAKATSPTAGWAAPAPWWPRWPMAACTLDKVWPVLPGQADRHGCASARRGARRRRRRGDGGGIPGARCTLALRSN